MVFQKAGMDLAGYIQGSEENVQTKRLGGSFCSYFYVVTLTSFESMGAGGAFQTPLRCPRVPL